MKKYQLIKEICNEINQKHKELFGWIEEAPLYKYELYTKYPRYDLQNLKQKEITLKKVIKFYSWLLKNAENLEVLEIPIVKYTPPFSENLQDKIYIKADHKNSCIYFLYGPEQGIPVIAQMKSLIEITREEIKETQNQIKQITKDVSNKELEIAQKILEERKKERKKEKYFTTT